MLKKGYIQTISFYDKNFKQIVFRQVVYPINNNQKDIYRYFLDSIPFEGIICVDRIEECYYMMNSSGIEVSNPSSIDNNWVDGNIYLIEYINDKKCSYCIFATTDNLTVLEVKKIVEYMASDIFIMHIDEMNGCWIKKY